MKKLALALVCLVSVAFFASCDPEEIIQEVQPNIEIITEDGYLQNGDVLDLGEVGLYGFRAASNENTQAELAKFVVTCAITSGEETNEPDVVYDTLIDGTEFVFEDYIYFEAEKDIIGTAEITATVTDVDGNSKSASFVISINESELLVAAPFEWKRLGTNDGTGLEQFGLKWNSNVMRGFYASIQPLEGATLYQIDDLTKWENITTAVEKAAFFTELSTYKPIDKFEEVELSGYTNGNEFDRDFLLATVYNGETYLIRIMKTSTVERANEWTIKGEYK